MNIKKINNRTHKESEELVGKLRIRLGESEELLRKMRMALYYIDRRLDTVRDEMEGMWYHDIDESHILISKSELFDVFQNKLLHSVKKCKEMIGEPLKHLSKFIGW